MRSLNEVGTSKHRVDSKLVHLMNKHQADEGRAGVGMVMLLAAVPVRSRVAAACQGRKRSGRAADCLSKVQVPALG